MLWFLYLLILKQSSNSTSPSTAISTRPWLFTCATLLSLGLRLGIGLGSRRLVLHLLWYCTSDWYCALFCHLANNHCDGWRWYNWPLNALEGNFFLGTREGAIVFEFSLVILITARVPISLILYVPRFTYKSGLCTRLRNPRTFSLCKIQNTMMIMMNIHLSQKKGMINYWFEQKTQVHFNAWHWSKKTQRRKKQIRWNTQMY